MRTGATTTRRGAAALLAAVVVLSTSACTTDDEEPARPTGVDPDWYVELDRAVEEEGELGTIPTLRQGECPIDTPEIGGHDLDEDTPDVGVSTLGDSGHRLICRWSPPSTDLVVTRFDDAAELELARDSVSELGEQDNGDNVQLTEMITVGERELFVRRTIFPTNDSHIDYSVWYLDDEEQGMVLLDIQAGDTHGLIETYDSQQAAEDMAALLS